MKTYIIILVSILSSVLFAADPNTLTFTAPIASPQPVEIGWKWYYVRATNNIVSNTPPTFLEFTRSSIQSTFDAHGYQFYNGYLAVQADREKAQQIRTLMQQLENADVDLLLRITYALKTNQVALSNAVLPVIGP